MNKNEIEEYLKTNRLPLSKDSLYTNIIITFILNILMYFIFRNMIATVISTVLFVIFSIVLLRNKRYLIENEIYLLVITVILGYWFWLVSVILFLLQQKHGIHFLFYIFEIIFLIAGFIYSKYKIYKRFSDNNHTKKNTLPKGFALKAALIGTVVAITFRIFFPPSIVSQTTVWYLFSAVLFFFVLLLDMLFANYLIIYISYLKVI